MIVRPHSSPDELSPQSQGIAALAAYAACIAIVGGMITGSPTIFFIATAALLAVVSVGRHYIRREQRDLMERLGSDASEQVPRDDEPLPRIPMW